MRSPGKIPLRFGVAALIERVSGARSDDERALCIVAADVVAALIGGRRGE